MFGYSPSVADPPAKQYTRSRLMRLSSSMKIIPSFMEIKFEHAKHVRKKCLTPARAILSPRDKREPIICTSKHAYLMITHSGPADRLAPGAQRRRMHRVT